MQGRITRRSMIHHAAVLTGLAAVGSTSASAAKPPQRNGASHMKLSLAAYSFNRFLPRAGSQAEPKMTLDGFIDFCAKLNLDGTELTSYYFPTKVTREYLVGLKEKTFRLGLDISGTAIGNDFCLPDGIARDKQIAHCKTWIDHAATMGAPVIRIFAGRVPKGDTEEVARERCIAGINDCLNYAGRKGVFLALENHGGITATPKQLLAIVEGIDDSPWFGINFDGGNFRTDDPYRDLEQIAPYAINAQLKVAVTRNGKKEHADLKRMVDMLKAANYRGYIVLEYEEKDPFGEIPGYIEQLREYIA